YFSLIRTILRVPLVPFTVDRCGLVHDDGHLAVLDLNLYSHARRLRRLSARVRSPCLKVHRPRTMGLPHAVTNRLPAGARAGRRPLALALALALARAGPGGLRIFRRASDSARCTATAAYHSRCWGCPSGRVNGAPRSTPACAAAASVRSRTRRRLTCVIYVGAPAGAARIIGPRPKSPTISSSVPPVA